MADVPDQEISDLLAEPLDRFVDARTARVKALKAAGQPDVAKALAKVRKPPVLVWAVGELARRHPDEAAEAAAVAADLEEATTGGEGDIRALLTQFREAIASLMQRADALQVDGSQVGLALRSVLGDADAREAWVEGRLLALPEQGGFGGPADLAAFATTPKPTTPSRPERAAVKRSAAKPRAGRDEADVAAERRAQEEAEQRAEEEAARQHRQEAVDRASERLAAARSRREEAAGAVEALEARLADLQEELDGARSALEAAGSEEETAADVLGRAEDELDQAG
jgi:hypothetical protein